MVYVDGTGIPLTTLIESAQESEYNLAVPTIAKMEVPVRPLHSKKRTKILVADKGYDATWLRESIKRLGPVPKIPKRREKGQTEEPKYNKRIALYYKRRWIVERTISWFSWYRRLLVRWERDDQVYEAFLSLACILICLKKF